MKITIKLAASLHVSLVSVILPLAVIHSKNLVQHTACPCYIITANIPDIVDDGNVLHDVHDLSVTVLDRYPCSRCLYVIFERLHFTRQCSNIFKVWWKILYNFVEISFSFYR